ncbi:DUF5786 family protein [Halomontanus rarus]|uniref:DUF5786 family protein n=1 Tax=Halomontanus rarus TaxID=3034020 RepID=UPI00293B975F|nr:DUF5786 family protein [Halovivax sp. KZCA124]
MGFGSYDESEQQHQDTSDDDEDDVVDMNEHEHDGEMTVETGGSTDDLLGQLEEIKQQKED